LTDPFVDPLFRNLPPGNYSLDCVDIILRRPRRNTIRPIPPERRPQAEAERAKLAYYLELRKQQLAKHHHPTARSRPKRPLIEVDYFFAHSRRHPCDSFMGSRPAHFPIYLVSHLVVGVDAAPGPPPSLVTKLLRGGGGPRDILAFDVRSCLIPTSSSGTWR